ncbi:MAG: hypothetical protein L6311_16360 [Cellulomonas sp.]|nr:hypothetical protein [Cellulomonas sp.]
MLKRLVIAVIGAVGVLAVGLAVASATLWRADDVLVATVASDQAYVVTAPGVIDVGGAPATVTASTSSGHPVVVVVGRDTDVLGWVGGDRYELVTGLSGWHTLATRAVTATATASASGAASPAAAASDAPLAATASSSAAASTPAPVAVGDPAGSDMWTASDAGTGSATLTWPSQPGRWSVLAASPDGTATTLSIAWPRTVTTPYLWPGVAVGGLLVLLALGLATRMWWTARRGDASWTAVEVAPAPLAAAPVPRTRRELREAERLAAGSRSDRPRTGSMERVPPPSRSRHDQGHDEGPAGPSGSVPPDRAVDSDSAGSRRSTPTTGPTPESVDASTSAPQESEPRGRRLLPRRRRPGSVDGGADTEVSTVAPRAGVGPQATAPSWVARPADGDAAAPAGAPAAPTTVGRPTWVPTRTPRTGSAPAGRVPGAEPDRRADADRRPPAVVDGPVPQGPPPAPQRRARPSWLGADRVSPPPVVPVLPPDQVAPASVPTPAALPPSPLLPPTVRADAWRRTWGISPADDAPAGSAPESAPDEPEDGR